MPAAADNPSIILASKSPRRRYLLKQAGLSFSVVPSHIEETAISISSPDASVRALAEAKARDVSEKYEKSWVIGADTIVLINGTILGKPDSRADARSMLKHLSGKTHRVLSGYCICCKAAHRCFSETVQTKVLFKNLTSDEIEWYIHTKEPFDKAGAYAIQGLGTFLVKSIHGSYTNVVGLPVCEIVEFFLKEGVIQHMTAKTRMKRQINR